MLKTRLQDFYESFLKSMLETHHRLHKVLPDVHNNPQSNQCQEASSSASPILEQTMQGTILSQKNVSHHIFHLPLTNILFALLKYKTFQNPQMHTLYLVQNFLLFQSSSLWILRYRLCAFSHALMSSQSQRRNLLIKTSKYSEFKWHLKILLER